MESDLVRRVAAGVKFSVLGPLTVTEGTATLNIGGPKQRTVLALLVSRAGSPVSADHLLVDAVYGDQAGPRSRRTIQTFVSTLRESLIRDFTPDECRTYGIERCDPTVN